jgi:hypothetical protein
MQIKYFRMPTVSPKEALRAITVFFYAMIGGLLMFAVIVTALTYLELPALTDKSTEQVFLIAVLIISIISISAAIRVYNKRIAEIHSIQRTLIEKFTMYRTALIFYLALCEGAGLFAIIVYFLTGNKLLLIAIAIVLLAMLVKRPEKFKIFNELQLSSEEQSELN